MFADVFDYNFKMLGGGVAHRGPSLVFKCLPHERLYFIVIIITTRLHNDGRAPA